MVQADYPVTDQSVHSQRISAEGTNIIQAERRMEDKDRWRRAKRGGMKKKQLACFNRLSSMITKLELSMELPRLTRTIFLGVTAYRAWPPLSSPATLHKICCH